MAMSSRSRGASSKEIAINRLSRWASFSSPRRMGAQPSAGRVAEFRNLRRPFGCVEWLEFNPPYFVHLRTPNLGPAGLLFTTVTAAVLPCTALLLGFVYDF